MENLIKDLGLPKQLDLAILSEVLSDNFLFEEERELLYWKEDPSIYTDVNDLKIIFSKLGIKVIGPDSFKTALCSSRLQRRRWIPNVFESLPEWDKRDRIQELANCFSFSKEEQSDIHRKVLQFWMVKSAEMVMKPEDINAVNRLVLTYQSDAQGIGKTTFARWLAEPFKMNANPSIKELEYPDNSKDTKIEFGKNIICLLDDINSWDARGLKKYKSIISSKTLNARLPYAVKSSYLPRTASFIATTNESGFLNESGNTRWAIFNLSAIDFDYSQIDQVQLWSQAKELVKTGAEIFDSEVREYSIKSSEQHNIVTELDDIVAYWFEFDPNGGERSAVLFDQIPVQEQQYFGYGGSRLSKFTKSIKRVFAEYGADIKYGSSGKNKWRVRLASKLDQG